MKNENSIEISNIDIKKLIYTIRGKQVMLDSDVAMLYHYETKKINQTVRRNVKRFPENFCFKLTDEETNYLRSQIVTLNKKINNGNVTRKYLPYVFTEQGIAMLSALLKNEIAVQVSINIMNAFVEMKRFLYLNGQIFERLTNMEYKLLEQDNKFKLYDNKIEMVFNELQKNPKGEFKEKIFYEGQIWDSYSLIIKIVKMAEKKITIIDNYIDQNVLEMLTKKNKNVEVVIITSQNSKLTNLDVKKFNEQYPTLKIARTNKFHDRFIIIDHNELYHYGASLKDVGKKCFAITKMEDKNFIEKIENKADN